MGTKFSRSRLRQLFEPFITQALRLPKWDDYERIKDLPQFEALSAFIQREAAAGKTGVRKAAARPKGATADANQFVWQFYLLPLVERCSEVGFDNVYTPLEQYLFAGHVNWTVTHQEVAPLPGFTVQSWPVELANGVTIRGLTVGEREDLVRMVGSMLVIEHGLVGARFAMSWWQPVPSALPGARRTSDDDFDTVVTALRLLKPGAVWYNVRGSWLGHPAFGSHPAAPSGTAIWEPKPGVHGAEYELLEQDVQPLSELVGSLVKASKHRQLQVALGRFNMAYERQRPDDKLIDYWVALEALFLADGRQELRYRVSLRVAWFVAQGSGERGQIFRQIRDSYDARSDIVHGGQPKDVPNIAQFTEDVLRRALRKAVATPGSLDPQQLDSLIVRGS